MAAKGPVDNPVGKTRETPRRLWIAWGLFPHDMANFSRKIDIYHTGKSTFGTPQNCIKCHFRVRVRWAGCVERAEENNGAPLR
jgi:hypothetical protein